VSARERDHEGQRAPILGRWGKGRVQRSSQADGAKEPEEADGQRNVSISTKDD